MKRNALIRIIIWSVIIAVLTGIMLVIMFGTIAGKRTVEIESATELVPVTAPTEAAAVTGEVLQEITVYITPNTNGTAKTTLGPGTEVVITRTETISGSPWFYITSPESGWILTEHVEAQANSSLTISSSTGFAISDVNIRTAPSTMASTAGMVAEGERVAISRQELVGGHYWAYITYPSSGWVVMDYISVSSPVPDETSVSLYIPESGEKDSFAASEISEIEIEWASGNIRILPGTDDRITVAEDGVSDTKYAMVLKQKGSKLTIAFCEEDMSSYLGLNSLKSLDKDLTITVPIDYVCESLEIDCASASVEIQNLTLGEVDFDGANGTCEFRNCTVQELNIDTASGDVRFSGTLDILDCDAASASVYAVLDNIPKRVAMDSMSGDLDLTLPENAGFTVTLDAMNSKFDSDFTTTLKNGSYVCGDGACRITMDAMSGDVIIRMPNSEELAPAEANAQ